MKRLSRRGLLLASGGAVALTGAVAPGLAPPARAEGAGETQPSGGRGGEVGTFPDARIDVAGQTRAYRLVVPAAAVQAGRAAPLLFAFHGLLDSKDLMPVYSRLDTLAAQQGIILVYPDALNLHWALVPAWAQPDLDFYDALFARLVEQYDVDLNRVYLTGMSNGAYFSHLLAALRPARIAAVAAHSGGLGLLGAVSLAVEPKYAVLVIHGEADRIVPVEEGRLTRDAYQRWGHPVDYLELPRHGHLWASGAGINARIWEFFAGHPRR